MPYKYLHKGNQYGLRNIRTGQVIWYDPGKVGSMERLKDMARIREYYSNVPRKKRGLAQSPKHTRIRVARMGGLSR